MEQFLGLRNWFSSLSLNLVFFNGQIFCSILNPEFLKMIQLLRESFNYCTDLSPLETLRMFALSITLLYQFTTCIGRLV